MSDTGASYALPLRHARSASATVSLWGAGKLSRESVRRKIELALKILAPPATIRQLLRVQQTTGDVRFDATFPSTDAAARALPRLAACGPTAGWCARAWAPFDERVRNKQLTGQPDIDKSLINPKPAKAFARPSSVVAVSVNMCSLGSMGKMDELGRLAAMHSASIIAAQGVYWPAAGGGETLGGRKRLQLPGYHTFFGAPRPSAPGPHGVLLAVRKPLDVWEFGPPTLYTVSVVVRTDVQFTLFVSVYTPGRGLRQARKGAIAAAFGSVRVFLSKHPDGNVCLLGDFNMGPPEMDKTLTKAGLGLQRVALAGDADGSVADFTYERFKTFSGNKENEIVRHRIDHAVVRRRQHVTDLVIDSTFAASDHLPLVCTVGTAVLTQPRTDAALRVDMQRLRALRGASTAQAPASTATNPDPATPDGPAPTDSNYYAPLLTLSSGPGAGPSDGGAGANGPGAGPSDITSDGGADANGPGAGPSAGCAGAGTGGGGRAKPSQGATAATR